MTKEERRARIKYIRELLDARGRDYEIFGMTVQDWEKDAELFNELEVLEQEEDK